MAVVLAFHGGGGNAAGFQRYAELDRIADRERFLVVYPNGTGRLPNRLLTWNAGDGCCGYAMTNRVDDVGFAVAVIADLERRAPIDRRRIYATGHSNGAILSHRLAAERRLRRPDRSSCRRGHRTFAPSRAVPVLQIHSVDDPRALSCRWFGTAVPAQITACFTNPFRRASTAGSRPMGARRAPTSPRSSTDRAVGNPARLAKLQRRR
jgi:poly(3-hydroxybutyrate) depolymerase